MRIQHDVHVGEHVVEGDRGVVDELVGAEPGQPVVAGAAGGADDVRAEVLGDLDGEVPDTAGGGMYQDALSRLRVG